MKRTFRFILDLTIASLVIASLPAVAHASPNSEFRMMIFPLECSVDLTTVGVGTYQQLTPENCHDFPFDDPADPAPTPTPTEPPHTHFPDASPEAYTSQVARRIPQLYGTIPSYLIPELLDDSRPGLTDRYGTIQRIDSATSRTDSPKLFLTTTGFLVTLIVALLLYSWWRRRRTRPE